MCVFFPASCYFIATTIIIYNLQFKMLFPDLITFMVISFDKRK
jgi:hypothetical protein